ncbi:MAG: AsmA-like C-terminal domain-containing protein [Litorimonas sp.]
MIQDADSLEPDISGIVPQEQPVAVSGLKARMSHPITVKIIGVLKRVARRVYAYSGELFAAICGLMMAWLYAVSWLITQQSVDVSRFKPDAERWFFQAFDGNNAKVDTLSLRWLPASDSVVFEVQDIIVQDINGQTIQSFASIKTGFPLTNVIAARPIPSSVDIQGGALSWVEDENGQITAGLGTPDTVGRLGPVYRGALPNISKTDSDDRTEQISDVAKALEGFQSLNVKNTVLYFQSKNQDVPVVLNLDALSLSQKQKQLNLMLEGEVKQRGDVAKLNIAVATDAQFSQFEGRAIARNLRMSELAPKKGRYQDFSRLNAPMNFDVESVFSQDSGLQASQVSLDIASGEITGFKEPLTFNSATFAAALEPGEQRMAIQDITLNSSKFSFTGTGDFSELGALNDGNINSSPVFDVKLKDVTIDAVPFFTAPLAFETVNASGQIDFDARRLSLPDLLIGLDGYGFDLSLDAIQNSEGGIDSLIASGTMNGNMGPRDLLALWPPALADGARRWVDSSVKDASIDDLKFKANLDAAYFENPVFTEDYITADLNVSRAVVKYIRTMPALENIRANGRLIGNRIEADVISGTVGALTIEKGSVVMPRLLPVGGDILINMTGSGAAAEMLNLVDNKPFEFASKYGVDPTKVGGQGRIEMSITRTMLVNFDQNRIEYAIKGDFSDAVAPFEISGQKITNGYVHFEADKAGLLMSGPVKIGPWQANMEWKEVFGENPPPTSYIITGLVGREMLDQFGIGLREYFDGTIPIEIKALGRGLDIQSGTLFADLTQAELSVSNIWSKAAGQNAALVASLERGVDGSIVLPQVDLKAPGLEILGNLEITPNLQLRVLDFSKMRVDGLMNAAVQLKPDAESQRFSLFVEGEYLDLSPWVSASLTARNSSAIDVPVLMTASMDRLTLKDDYVISNAKFLFAHSGVSLTGLRLGGSTEDGEFKAEVVSDQNDKTRLVTVRIPNASKAASAFLGLTNMEGGTLNIAAKLPPIDTEGATVGNAEITAFKLNQAPFLAQILSLASLTGLVDTLGGDGLSFDRFEAPFTLSDNLLQIRGARVYGPALGMTGEGDIQLDTRALDFDGTVVPAYAANTILGDIPVLGSLLGKKGEGVFALNYAVRGPFEKVQISVNPLSALTPGFLRGIFRPQREKLSDEIMEQIEAVRPKEDE